MRIFHYHELSPYVREAGLYAELYPYINLTPNYHRNPWESAKRRIYDYQFIYCTHGTSHIMIGENSHVLKRGSLAIVPPNVKHSFGPDYSEDNGLYWFHCDLFYYPDNIWLYDFYSNPENYITLFSNELQYPEHIREQVVFEDGYTLPEHVILDEVERTTIIFKEIYREYTYQRDKWRLTTKPLVLELINLIIHQTNQSIETKSKSKDYFVVHTIKDYISKNYYKKIYNKDICESTGLNNEYASKIFKQHTGMRLNEYIIKYRIDKSKSLLLDLDLSISDIAEMVGFCNVNYYSALIKKHEGKTPSELRCHLLDIVDR